MKKILIGSVFGPSERNQTWYDLQLEFLNKTTNCKFDHVVFLSGADKKIFSSSQIIGEVENTWEPLEVEGKTENFCPHILGVQTIIKHFHREGYDHCLILDSDCFPIQNDWHEKLLEKMGGKSYAAPIRTENLDVFPHPSAFFIKTLCGVRFKPTQWIKNLLGEDVLDNGSCIPMDETFPLMRTNKYNPHPIFAGIYYDMFYHHCCGSRTPDTRSTKSGYYDILMSQEEHVRIEQYLFEALKKNPSAFLKKLKCTISL